MPFYPFDRLASDVPSGGEFCPFCRHAFGDGLFPRICGCEFGFCDSNSVGDKQWGCRNDCRSGNGQRYQHNLFGKVNESLDITLKFIIAFGLCFQLPVLLTLMGKAGLVNAEGLGSVRKYAVVGILLWQPL